ncbi:hypothetical protein H7J93_12320 [Mycobacterium barrassiae]|uniref:hypothetical protein n=1 Tax=Mycobacterium barrassiae TaxID=319709 RepID=UPI002265C070|nr:hypothetical protein [Mycobacterium barrassiae]MCV7300415.1 hypothetical protein [Mycobacterium barrassiae]
MTMMTQAWALSRQLCNISENRDWQFKKSAYQLERFRALETCGAFVGTLPKPQRAAMPTKGELLFSNRFRAAGFGHQGP